MSSKIFSATTIGLDSEPIEVESDISAGLGNFIVVGLPDTAVQEARERVRSAIKNSSFSFPQTRITINLAPADIKKEGPIFDLPIAISILLADSKNFIPKINLEKSIFIGELALDGRLRKVNGVLPIALMAEKLKFENLFLPKENIKEASLIKGINIVPIKNLNEIVEYLLGNKKIKTLNTENIKIKNIQKFKIDFQDIHGQEFAKKALEIAAAGAHNVLFNGPPGAGKTMLANAFPSILPPLTEKEILETTKIYSVLGKLSVKKPLITIRPFRNPHHTSSYVALVGGGTYPKPGEISLAHRGVLFLDEFPEFNRQVLESLRQPLEDGQITVSRAQGSLVFPAKFILIAAQNPCPCGYYTDPDKECVCSANQIIKYQRKISGPLLDRIDLNIDLQKVKTEKLITKGDAENSESIRNRVIKARKMQKNRFKKENIITNSEMSTKQTEKYCQTDKESSLLLKQAIEKFNLSARSYFRILKLARTIADLNESEEIKKEHIAEALQYRPKSN